MAYRVRITKLGLADISECVRFYAETASTDVARRWLDELDERILDLEQMPHRFPYAPENDDLDFEVRQLHHYSHRIIFLVTGEEPLGIVHIMRIYHGSRRSLKHTDFDLT